MRSARDKGRAGNKPRGCISCLGVCFVALLTAATLLGILLKDPKGGGRNG